MTSKEIDSEVLRIIIEVLRNTKDDKEASGLAREDATFWLGMIGEAYIDVTSWKKYDVEKNPIDLALDEILDE